MELIKNVWAYRFFILSSIKTEFKARFVRSRLGAIWMILHPLAQVAIYALVLSAVLKAKLPGIDSQYAYSIYLMSGMVAWTLFVDIVGRLLTVFIDNGNLLKKMSFPKITLLFIVVGSALINFLLLFLAIFVVFGLLGHVSLSALYWLPMLVSITLMMAIGIGLLLGILNVFIRDVGQVMSIVLQFWFWLTPVVYNISMMPEKYQSLFLLNPMTGIVLGYHNVLVYNKPPDPSLLIYPLVVGILSLSLAFFIYKKANEDMADVL